MNDEVPRPTSVPARQFVRSLSAFGVLTLTLSVLSPGVSVFVSGAAILTQAGSGAVVAFVLGGLICYCQTAMAAELGAAYPTAGYNHAAIGHALGDWAGATCYMASMAVVPLFLNISAAGIATYLHPFGLPLNDHATTLIVVAVITALALLNIRANEYITGGLLLMEFATLLFVAGIGVAHVQPGAAQLILRPTRFHDGVWAAAGVGVVGIAINNASWVLGGASQALMFSEDMKRPQLISRVIFLAFAITLVLELAPVFGAIVGAHDLKGALSSRDPFQTFLSQYLPAYGLKLISLSIAFAIFNACLAGFIGIGRTTFTMARTRLFAESINRPLMQLLPSTQAPWLAILVIAASTAAATFLSLEFKLLIMSGDLTFVTVFLILGVAVRRRRSRTGGAPTERRSFR